MIGFHSRRNESCTSLLERINCHADLVLNLPSDVIIQKMRSETSRHSIMVAICSAIADGRAYSNRPKSHPVSSKKSCTLADVCCLCGKMDANVESPIQQSYQKKICPIPRHHAMCVLTHGLNLFSLFQIGETE